MKISIIGGAGRIGSHIAFTLLLSDLKIDELVLEDVLDSVQGEAMDLEQAACGLNKKIKISGTKGLKDCAGSDIVAIVAGLSLSSAKTSNRYELLGKNFNILKSVLEELPDNGKTIYIMISNHVDVLTYFLTKKINSRRRVIGISTLTDTMRMNLSSDGYLIGEHAGFMVPIDGDCNIEEIKKLGLETVKSKGGTWFATPVGVVSVIKSIVNNEKKQFPVSVLLEGEYGLHDVCLSVPCVIGKTGIEKIKEIMLNAEQKLVLKKAADSVRGGINSVN